MTKARASSVAAPGRDARSIAEEAARRAGMGLGDWLDAVVAEQAGRQGASIAAANDQPQAKDHVGAGPLVQALRGQIAALTSRVERIDAINADQRPAPADAEALRAGLASMTQSVVDLAPRDAAAGLEGAVSDLGQRLDAARRAGASDNLVAPVETMLRQLVAAFRRHDPRAAVERLEGELRTLGKKVDSLISATISPEAWERIQKQTEEIRDLLAAAATSPFPFQRIERHLGNLADRIEILTTSARPQRETLRAVESLSEARSQIDRSSSASTLSTIESRLDRLAARVDEALQRASETTADLRPTEKLSRAVDEPTSATDSAELTARLRSLIDRLGETVNRAPSAELDSLPLKDLARSAESLQANVERQADSPRQAARLEGAPEEIDRLQAMAAYSTTPTATLREPASFPSVDPQPFGKLEMASSEVSATQNRENRSSDEIRALAVRELEAHFDNMSKGEVDVESIQQVLNQLSAKMDAFANAEIDLRSLEFAISALNEKLDFGDTSQPAGGAGIERAIGELLRQLDATRLNLQSAASNRSSDLDLAREILDLRAEQRSSDRRTSERLSGVQSALDRLLGRMESAAAPADEGVSGPSGASTHFATDEIVERLRDIPDRAPARPQPPPAKRLIDASNVLLEPGASAPKPPRADNAETAGKPERSDINVHIAAARRAAQAALVESASKKLQLDSPLPSSSLDPTQSNAAPRRSRLIGRRRPVLLAIALIATTTTAAAIGWREGWPQVFRRLQFSATVPSADPGSRIPKGDGKARSLGTIDYNSVGDIAPPGPKTSDHPARPAPADLVASIPTSLTQSLRDEAAGGDPGAETELGLRYLDGRTIAKDPAAAVRWLELAAVQGLPIAQYRLATLYEKGNGVARDTALARAWYLKAANAGNARAMHNLGVLIAEDPRDGKTDYAESAHWFRQAGELGVRDSQFNLGVLYGRGLGVPQDLGQSWLWFSLAARQGDVDAGAKRDEVAAKLDANAQAAASKALAEFKTLTPSPEANGAPSPVGGGQGGANEPPSVPAAPPVTRGAGVPGASG